MSRRRGRAGRKASKRFDPTALREALGVGDDVAAVLGVVVEGSDGRAYDLDVVGGELREITVELQLVPAGGPPVTARLAFAGGSRLRGVFALPEVGDEFLVHFVGNDRSNPVAAFPLSGPGYPSAAQLATGGKLVLAGVEVLVTDADGGNEVPLVTLPQFLEHLHGTGTGPSAQPTDQSIPGTIILKAK